MTNGLLDTKQANNHTGVNNTLSTNMTNGLLDTKQANNHTGVNNTLSTNSKNTDSGLLGQITHCKKFDSEANVANYS